MKLAVLFSGGKDSCLALHKVLKEGHDVRYLLNVFSKNADSFMFHRQDRDLLYTQVGRLGIDMISVESEGVEEKELEDLKRLIEGVGNDVEGIVVGGIASNYQGERVKKVCKELDLKFITPLWNYDGEKIWKELLEGGFKVILTKVSCDGLGKEWLGEIIDDKMLEELKKLGKKFGFRIDFEGGEAESAVLGMKEFKKDIKIKFNIKSEGEYRHFLNITKVG